MLQLTKYCIAYEIIFIVYKMLEKDEDLNNHSVTTVFVVQPQHRLGKNLFFVNSEILGIQIWRGKKRVKDNQFEMET